MPHVILLLYSYIFFFRNLCLLVIEHIPLYFHLEDKLFRNLQGTHIVCDEDKEYVGYFVYTFSMLVIEKFYFRENTAHT